MRAVFFGSRGMRARMVADLPDPDNTSLPPLPERPTATPDEDTEDELLGGPTN